MRSPVTLMLPLDGAAARRANAAALTMHCGERMLYGLRYKVACPGNAAKHDRD